jgi:tetracycline 7-halogenase / FADH2 O2-dependent halogenase
LLVAASPDDFHSDTHWLRADVDAFLAAEAQAAGVPLLDHTAVTLDRRAHGWRLSGTRQGAAVQIDARFLIDGTGEYGLVPRTLGIPSLSDPLYTNSRAIFAHFRGLRPWHEVLAARGGAVDDHPFDCDRAALHHVLEEGWMFQLGFNNGVTSAGFVLDAAQHPLDETIAVEAEWRGLVARYPDIAEQFANATIVAPEGGLVRTGRLQRRRAQMAGENWALLPHTAGFIDPLHSTGIAQTLCGIQRLIAILEEHWNRPELALALNTYRESLDLELFFIDRLVSACYMARRSCRLFAACAMLYFAGAHTSEMRRMEGRLKPGEGFLCRDDRQFLAIVTECWQRVRAWHRHGALAGPNSLAQYDLKLFEQFVAKAIRPYNAAGLLDPSVRNMYRYTAIDKR